MINDGTKGECTVPIIPTAVRFRRPLLWIFLTGLVLRLVFLAGVEITGRLEIAEGVLFRDLAVNILEGRGLSVSPALLEPRPGAPENFLRIQQRWRDSGGLFGMIPPGEPTAFFMPLYPLFLAGVFSLFGTAFFPVRLVQLLLSALLPLLAHQIGRRAVNRETGLIAAALAAVHPYFIYYSGLLVTQIPYLFLLALASAAYYGLRERPTVWRAALLGLLLGLSFLTRTFTIVFLPLVLLMILFEVRKSGALFRPRALVAAAVVLLCFAVTVAPWPIRNQAVFGETLLLPTKGGRNLWEYNNQKFSAEFQEVENPWTRERYQKLRADVMPTLRRTDLIEFPVFHPHQSESERNRILTGRVRGFIAANPGVYLRLCLVRAGEMIRVAPVRKSETAIHLAAWLTIGWQLPLALLGMLLLAPSWRRGPLYLYVLTLFYFAFHALVASGTPHRVQVDLYLLIFAAYPLSLVMSRLRHGKRHRGGAAE